MGRYTQRRRAAAGPSPAAAPPPVPLNVVLVFVNDTDTVTIQFDGDPGFVASPSGSDFTVNGFGPNAATDLGGGAVEVSFSFGTPPISAGDPWDISASPGWITNPVAFPQSGVTI